MSVNEEYLKRLTEVNGIGGNERYVRELFKEETKDQAEEYLQDGLGGIFAKHTGNADGPRVMLAAHLDEVGFMVKEITDEGFLKFVTIGGWWSQVVLAQQVTVTTREGKTFHGVTGSKPPHVLTAEARKKPMEFKDIFIDLGASSKDEVMEWGIRPGDMITPYIETRRLNGTKFLLGKAWDNRIGMAVAIDVLKNLAKDGHETVLFSGANVQEEVGLRGARVAAHMINPDISFALDTGTAGDTPGMTKDESASKLGKGPQIIVFDSSMIAHRGLREFVVEVAERENIPYQFEFIPGGGTDAGSQHLALNGIPSIAITVPVRYLHSHTSVIHEDDYLNMVKLVTAVVKELSADTIKQIKENA
ncbi:M42 family metallopeptidase [Facklamia miroungae]|uniref:Putative aminopeptidase FrvX n=1 Tax=Facklamia miroungae TaxID=120956 RepID=A0A1G7SFG2_9LACT|nr:M42 family metallopeptidase [Facklamia miroungae]NKZ29673.1 M42 family metallopeptidase [Facklamia miroungae]SDG21652.1 Putative aminopeptidase FrvX [Facklamia miroungae]